MASQHDNSMFANMTLVNSTYVQSSYLECALLDNDFGPHAQSCRGGFDFTLFFEETNLTISPLALLILIAPLRIFYLFRKDKKAHGGPLLYTKLVSLSSIVGMSALPRKHSLTFAPLSSRHRSQLLRFCRLVFLSSGFSHLLAKPELPPQLVLFLSLVLLSFVFSLMPSMFALLPLLFFSTSTSL
jgi:hypothetical protein